MTDENKEMQPVQSKEISFGEGVTKKALAALKRKYKKVPDFDTKEGYAEGKKSLSVLTKTRTGLEAERKLQNAEALKHQANVNRAAKAIKEEIEAIEKPIRDARKVVDDRKEQEKRDEEQAEQRRIDDIEGKVADIYAMTEGLLTADLPALEERLAEAQAIEITDDEYMEFVEPAKLAINNVTSTLTNAVESRKVLAEQEAGLQKQKDELVEQEKETKLKDSIQRIKLVPIDLMGKPMDELVSAQNKLQLIDASDYGVFSADASEAIDETINKVQGMINQQQTIDDHNVAVEERKKADEQKEAAERKKADNEKNAEKLKARMPEDQKLRAYADALGDVEVPAVEDTHLKAVMVQALYSVAETKEYVYENTQDSE